jgi:hypothetical protein
LAKSGSAKTTLINLPIFDERLLRGCNQELENDFTFFIFIFKTIYHLQFWKIKIRYVFRSAYLRNGFDKLFGYQYHLSAILPERL